MPADALYALSCAVALGAVLIAVSARINVPSIALLLLGGIAVGPEGIGWIDPADLGSGLRLIIGAAVAVILFEGGLTLDFNGYRRASTTISRLLTIGVALTWLGATTACHLFLDLDLTTSLVAGSLVIVTGPTVISPLLRRIGVGGRVKSVLYWEAVLVDAVGVFAAIMAFEWLTTDGQAKPIVNFLLRFGVGAGIGIGFGLALGLVLRFQLIATQYANIVVLGVALLTFAVADRAMHEAGILAVIIAGMAVSAAKPPTLHELKQFKLELTELGIGVLFILLAAKLEIAQFEQAGIGLVAAVAVVVVILRPIVVTVSTWGQGFSLAERAFLSWIAPRGIVAASMASLFAIELAGSSNPNGPILEAFVFAVIGTTVILQGMTAGWLATVLGLREKQAERWLIVGAPSVADAVAAAIRDAGGDAIAMSAEAGQASNDAHASADDSGVLAFDPLDPKAADSDEVGSIGNFLAITKDPHLNHLACMQWRAHGVERCYAWSPGFVADGVAVGESVWESINMAEVESGLEKGELAFEACTDSETAAKSTVLLEVAGKGLDIARPGETPAPTTIILRRRHNIEALVAQTIHVEGGESLESVVAALLALAAEDLPELPHEELLSAAVGSEVLVKAGGRAGVALPHARHPSIDSSRLYIATIDGGVVVDEQMISVVFLVLSPTGKAAEHLKTLAAVARFTRDPSELARLRRLTAPQMFNPSRASTADPAE